MIFSVLLREGVEDVVHLKWNAGRMEGANSLNVIGLCKTLNKAWH
jgi:hypothetical protein